VDLYVPYTIRACIAKNEMCVNGVHKKREINIKVQLMGSILIFVSIRSNAL